MSHLQISGLTAVTAVITVGMGWVEFHSNTEGTVASLRYYHGNGEAYLL